MAVPFRVAARTSVEFGAGAVAQIGTLARQRGFRRTMLAADSGMIAAGYVARVGALLEGEGIAVVPYHEFAENPDSAQLETAAMHRDLRGIDSIVALGGGSSLDFAKGFNFLVTNGGRIHDYHGYDKASKPLLPMIGVPTTTGTGSEAQSYALISDAETHVKMACGAPSAAFSLVILDPELASSQPRSVLAASGYDAISHAVESFVTTKGNLASDCFARQAWRLLEGAFEGALTGTGGIEAVAHMQLGAYWAGAAIECSMLGATHATANPLTAHFGTTHGVAIAVMLAPVVRWNSAVAAPRYRELHPDLPARLDELARAAGLPRSLGELRVPESMLTQLADDASKQWTGRFNPRPFDVAAALEIYRCAY
ncbi:MAG: iron-containing alcohol dehydrogenase [Bryobacteraceae bacterium]